MKYFGFLLVLTLFSCEKKKNANRESLNLPTAVVQKSVISAEDSDANSPWFGYYQNQNPDFTKDLFELKGKDSIVYRPGTVKILHEKGFNEVYEPFLIFNKSKTKYLDLDSYHWFPLPDGSAAFEADQQIVLVDTKARTAKQIAFFGPSFTIEDAYWKGDTVAVLLGNSYEKVPFMLKYNFEKKQIQNFQYPDTLVFTIPYSKIRLRNKGIKVD